MDFSQLQDLAARAGFTGSDARVAAAVALAESSGNPQAIGDYGKSIGLWQIYLPAHPQFADTNLIDPETNAAAAYSVFQDQGFAAWTTFRNGKFMDFLPGGAPASSDSAFTTGTAVTDTGDSSFTQSLLWAGIALAALWLFEEVWG